MSVNRAIDTEPGGWPGTCVEVASRALYDSGIRYVFGYPGGEVVDFIEALECQGIDFILTGHESTAALMSGAIGRLTGRPGVCLATLGPGACNLVLGVGCAYLDRDPVLAFSGAIASRRAHLSNKQNLNLVDMFAPLTKWSGSLTGIRTEQTIRAAIGVTQAHPRGPVYLSVPSDIAKEPDQREGAGLEPPALPVSSDGQFDRVASGLNKARRPVAVIGCGVDVERDTDPIRSFLSSSGIPFVVLPQAKGVASEEGRMFMGTVTSAAGDKHIVESLNQSDFLLGIGFDPVESYQDWHLRRPVFSLANGPTGFDRFRPEAECIGDLAGLMKRLEDSFSGSSEWTPKEIEGLRRRVSESITPPVSSGTKGLSPYHVVSAVRESLPSSAVVTTGAGAHKMVMCQAWPTKRPRSFLVSNGLSAMGFGFCAALAASFIDRSGYVVAIIGDGEFAMMVQELETACRLGLRPLMLVLCDRSLAVIKIAQKNRGKPPRGVDFGSVDWVRVAQGFGAAGRRASTLVEVQQAVEDWVKAPELTVLEVPVDESLYCGLDF